MPEPPKKLTLVLEAVDRGEAGAEQELFARVYDELKIMARARKRAEGARHALQTTALVNEAYLRLVGGGQQPHWENRRHFFGAAARAMRRILVDKARERLAAKRGAGQAHVPLDDRIASEADPTVVVAVDEALTRLEAERAPLAEVVYYRYFLGMTVQETAEQLGLAPRTINYRWELARAWLQRELSGHDPQAPPDV